MCIEFCTSLSQTFVGVCPPFSLIIFFLLQETTPSSLVASRFKYNTNCIWEFSLAQWLWYRLFVQAYLVQTLSRCYISAMHLFICFFVTDFVRKISEFVSFFVQVGPNDSRSLSLLFVLIFVYSHFSTELIPVSVLVSPWLFAGACPSLLS